ncbi:hypothetical protein BDZ91DRAFT_751801 [Kalaharituber pfeilii]|nr:hypothetical protein BDZ91DRAFT_751801 [Kalaharituber pfeilii]
MPLYTKTFISEQKGYGMVASAAIPQGTLLLSEVPLFTFPSNTVQLESLSDQASLNTFITRAVHKLPKAKQNAFLGLHNAQVKPYSTLPPFLGICGTNCFGLGVRAVESGVFEECSRFNHSCIPNANHTWNLKSREMEIRAIKDIEQGAEITICYLSTKESFQPHRVRQAILQQRYRFLCNCPGCTEPESIANDGYRAQVSTLNNAIGDGILIATNPSRALRHCKRVIGLLPLVGQEEQLQCAYYDAFQIAIAHGDQSRASAFMKLFVKYVKLFEGDDSEHLTAEKTALVARPQLHRLSETVSKKWLSRVRMTREEGSTGFEEWLWMRAEK